MRKTLAIFVLNLFLLSGATALLGACNTAAGVGQDISATGNAITGGPTKAGRVKEIRSVESLPKNPGRE